MVCERTGWTWKVRAWKQHRPAGAPAAAGGLPWRGWRRALRIAAVVLLLLGIGVNLYRRTDGRVDRAVKGQLWQRRRHRPECPVTTSRCRSWPTVSGKCLTVQPGERHLSRCDCRMAARCYCAMGLRCVIRRPSIAATGLWTQRTSLFQHHRQ